jgi:hypothetical protein
MACRSKNAGGMGPIRPGDERCQIDALRVRLIFA